MVVGTGPGAGVGVGVVGLLGAFWLAVVGDDTEARVRICRTRAASWMERWTERWGGRGGEKF